MKLFTGQKIRPLLLFSGTNRCRCENSPEERKKEREKQHGAIIKKKVLCCERTMTLWEDP